MLVVGRAGPGFDTILTDEAQAFLSDLHERFDQRRIDLLTQRRRVQTLIDEGHRLGFLDSTTEIRTDGWRVAPPPDDLADRRCEITGPTDRKMVINALNSGARVFMADFEDSNSPTWANMVEGQINLRDAVRRRIDFTAASTGKQYQLCADPATLMVRPRGLHLPEPHILVDGDPIAGSLMDFGLFVFHNARELVNRGSGPYFYLPKLESHLEARWWNDVFIHTETTLGLDPGTIKATVLIETIPAAFEMDEILYELRDHSAGLNAGRWDYIFSVIKKHRNSDGLVFPDRGQIGMTVPFMRAYTELLVATCHRRGAHAMGGMAAFIPSRNDPTINEIAIAKVEEDKKREATDGCDGTWVAHPDLVPIATAIFDAVLGDRPNQIDKLRPDVDVQADELLDFAVPDGTITDEGVRLNIDVAIRYIASWLNGTGAAAIYNLMEDAATAEISRSQIWQWVRSGAATDSGTPITADLVRRIADEETDRVRDETDGHDRRLDEARELFERVALASDFPEFLTLPAYDLLENH
ncbi:MAG: malate synthase A, partial [Acidimicrobiia bacterium]|nr:malate synthase A [Acidimicrobiia bacterium]